MKRTIALLVALAAVPGAAVATAASAEPVKSTALPAKVIGRWSRAITNAQFRKYGESERTGTYTITIKRPSFLAIHGPGTESVTTSIAAAPDGTLRMGPLPGCLAPGRYRWNVAGTRLTLAPVADRSCGLRRALFTGGWSRS